MIIGENSNIHQTVEIIVERHRDVLFISHRLKDCEKIFWPVMHIDKENTLKLIATLRDLFEDTDSA